MGMFSAAMLRGGCIINTTAEIVLGECENLSFSRKLDESTGFDELEIENKK
jgi:predicted DNA-binding protein with PD1-like motif